MSRSRPDNASERRAHDELQCYTLAHRGAEFIHQHVVDAWIAQHADANTKPISLTFALIGLYLHVERGFSGRRVQRVHMALGRRTPTWPVLTLPAERGNVTAVDVMKAAAGEPRDTAIDAWCSAVWAAYRPTHRDRIVSFLAQNGTEIANGASSNKEDSD